MLIYAALCGHFMAEATQDLDLAITLDSVSNVDGGLAQSTETLINIDLIYANQFSEDIDGFIYVIADYGGDPSVNIGDAQVTDNIESADTTKIYEAWMRYKLNESYSFTFGLHDYNSKFYTIESSSSLINSSFGIGPDTSQVGPSIFSTTALGLISSFETSSNYWHLGIYDGVPGDPDDESGTHIKLGGNDGVFTGFEWGVLSSEKFLKLGFGAWYHTAKVISPIDGTAFDRNSGAYVIAESKMSKDASWFFQLGSAKPSKNIVDKYLGLGITFNGVYKRRDKLSVGLAHAKPTSKVLVLAKSESAIELTYQLPLNNGVILQPDIQYILNPGFSSDIDNAIVFTFRFIYQKAF